MKPITKTEFKAENIKHSYIKGRWAYYKIVIDYIMSCNANSCLEIGPGCTPLFCDSDIFDIRELSDRTVKFLCDCDNTPWDIGDKSYDFLVASHVFEHLSNPVKVFKEAKRVANNIVLVLPYKWRSRSKHSSKHWHIDENKIYEWTGLEPSLIKYVKVKDNKKTLQSIICFYEI
ncbi:MAG: methyltransferase domain-containing protein [Candidatus Scalindua sp.]|jgi:hypothetical protein|nr:methyltransferase domain-containing protein [Candidatus Scalindua sp.]